MKPRAAVTIIGIGDDGCVGLSSRAINAVTTAQVLAGGERHLAFFPQFEGERIVLKGKLQEAVDKIHEQSQEQRVCVLASGDPCFFGIGTLLIKTIGSEHVEIIPHPTTMQWAFARLGIKWNDAEFLSCHGRPLDGFVTRIKRHAKIGCFTDEENAPNRIAARMREYGEIAWTAWVCENLGGVDERVRRFSIDELADCQDISPLNVLILLREEANWRQPVAFPFFPEERFAKRMPKKGLITKREVRALSLATLRIRPDSVVWDIGAGSGALTIEAAMLAYKGHVFAIEVDPEGIQICRDNLKSMAIDNVTLIHSKAPEGLEDLPSPDAIFIGGSKGNLDTLILNGLKRLQPQGRMVVNAITLDSVSEAYQVFRRHDIVPEVTLLNVARGAPLAHYVRYEAMNPIHIFAVTKPDKESIDE